jgi:hypothetical protein
MKRRGYRWRGLGRRNKVKRMGRKAGKGEEEQKGMGRIHERKKSPRTKPERLSPSLIMDLPF